jgi:dTDP-4-dehydrorhamnose 3,5-epimerase
VSKFPPKFKYGGSIKGVISVKADVFDEERGCLYSIYNDKDYSKGLKGISFVEHRVTITRGCWGRGMHADNKTWKLISCVAGKFNLILLDGRLNSPTYGKKAIYGLKYNKGLQILVPPGVYNGHLNPLWEPCTLHYAWSHSYEGVENQKTVSFLDPIFGWDRENLKILLDYKLSDRDLNKTIPFLEAGFE